jgi:hypothetical protein
MTQAMERESAHRVALAAFSHVAVVDAGSVHQVTNCFRQVR